MTTQQGDVSLFQTTDDGEIIVTNGIVSMSGGLETSAYLSIFGGNEDDDGRNLNSMNWWGNLDESQPVMQYHSETQFLLTGIPATTGNMRRVEDAVNRDLAWLISENIASSVIVSVTIPELNRVKITVTIEAKGFESEFEFVENWKVAS